MNLNIHPDYAAVILYIALVVSKPRRFVMFCVCFEHCSLSEKKRNIDEHVSGTFPNGKICEKYSYTSMLRNFKRVGRG